MKPPLKKYFRANRARWDELVDIHAQSAFYDLAGFKAGESSLFPQERKELGKDVQDQHLLHLQCHFGMDTLSWAREGAIVTGVDFSGKAIRQARALAEELDIPARFVQANVLELPNHLDGQFDVVFTSYGVLSWLPDLAQWARVIDHFLVPGGIFYVIDGHPFGERIDERSDETFEVGYPYFTDDQPFRWYDDVTYTDMAADREIAHPWEYAWFHTLGDIVNALLDVGLQLEFLHEFPWSFYQLHDDMVQRADRLWYFEDKSVSFVVPLTFSIKARKPLDPDVPRESAEISASG